MSKRSTLKAVLASAVFALAAHGGAAAADYVILESDAAGIEPGIVVDGSADIVIPEGAQVVLIDPNGETRVVAGPYAGIVANARGATGTASAIDRLTTQRGKDTKVLGAVRGVTVDGGSVKE